MRPFMSTWIFTALGIGCGLFCQAIYIHGMVRKTVKPHPFTWFIWAITMGVAAAAQWAGSGGWGALVLFLAAAGAVGIWIGSLWCGYRGSDRTDWLLLGLALLTIPLWLLTESPLGAVILATGIDLFGYLPTYRKSWNLPHDESVSAFLIGALGMLFSALAMDTTSFVTLCYPVAIVIANLVLCILLAARRRQVALLHA